MKLEPGWLMRTCHDAHIRTMLNSSPSYALAYSIQTPIPDDEAAELYAMMAARFEGWTGKSLEDQQKEQKVKKMDDDCEDQALCQTKNCTVYPPAFIDARPIYPHLVRRGRFWCCVACGISYGEHPHPDLR